MKESAIVTVHRQAKRGLIGRTSSSPAYVLRMAEAVATSQRTEWFHGLGPLTVGVRSEHRMQLGVLGGLGGTEEQLAFVVTATPDAGCTAVRTRIASFRTSRTTLLGFIPAGPKVMHSYPTYELFLERLSATILDADAAAMVVVADSVDTAALPAARAQILD